MIKARVILWGFILAWVALTGLFLSACGVPGMKNLTYYEPEEYNKYIEFLDQKYNVNLDFVNFYYGTPEEVENSCSQNSYGCAYNQGIIILREDWKNSCFPIIHEFMHFILYELEGNTDPAHKSEEWNKISDLCEEFKNEE